MRSFWKQKVGFVLPLITVMMIVMLVNWVIAGYRDWLVGALGMVIIIAIATMIFVYAVHLNRSLERFRRMEQPTATLELMDDFFKISTENSLVEIQWSQVTTLWCFENAWLMFFSASEFLTLPLAEMSEQEKSFIVEKVKGQGVEISS